MNKKKRLEQKLKQHIRMEIKKQLNTENNEIDNLANSLNLDGWDNEEPATVKSVIDGSVTILHPSNFSKTDNYRLISRMKLNGYYLKNTAVNDDVIVKVFTTEKPDEKPKSSKDDHNQFGSVLKGYKTKSNTAAKMQRSFQKRK